MAKRLTRRRFIVAACSSLAIALTGCEGVLPTPKRPSAIDVVSRPTTSTTRINLRKPNLSSYLPSEDSLQMVGFREGDFTSKLSTYEHSLVFEKLLYIDPRNSNLTPGLAERVEWIDPLTFNFELTPGRSFHSIDNADAISINAQTILDNAERARQADTFLWNQVVTEMNGFVHTDSLREHVVIKLDGVYATFFDELASTEGEITGPQSYPDISDLVGSGPFIPVSESDGTRYLRRNQEYARSKRANIAEIHFKEEASKEAMADGPVIPEILTGTNDKTAFHSSSGSLQHRIGSGQWYLGLRIHAGRSDDISAPTKLMSDQRIRIAIAKAINSDEISKQISGRKPTLIAGPYRADILPREEIETNKNIVFDSADAKRLALGANYQGQRLRLLHQNITPDTSIALLIRDQLQASGFNVELEPTSPELFQDDLDTREYEMALLHLEGFQNANQALKIFAHNERDPRFANYWAFSSPEVNSILKKADASVLPWERTYFHLEAQRRLLDLGPALIPLASEDQVLQKPSNLTNYYHDAYNYNDSVLSRFWRVNRNI